MSALVTCHPGMDKRLGSFLQLDRGAGYAHQRRSDSFLHIWISKPANPLGQFTLSAVARGKQEQLFTVEEVPVRMPSSAKPINRREEVKTRSLPDSFHARFNIRSEDAQLVPLVMNEADSMSKLRLQDFPQYCPGCGACASGQAPVSL